MVQEPAGAPQPTDIVPGEPVAVGVTLAHVLALASHHVVHHVQVVILGDVAAAGGEHTALVRHCGGRGGGSVLRYVIVLSVNISHSPLLLLLTTVLLLG